jgi:hypothetical protein
VRRTPDAKNFMPSKAQEFVHKIEELIGPFLGSAMIERYVNSQLTI